MVVSVDPIVLAGLRPFGFREYPFSSSPDQRFFYLSQKHGPILSDLEKSITEYTGITVVEGPAGIGLSTMAMRLRQILAGGAVAFVSANKDFKTKVDTVKLVGGSLGRRSGRSYEDRIAALAEFFKQSPSDEPGAILIDDAQLMAPDALTALKDLDDKWVRSPKSSTRPRIYVFTHDNDVINQNAIALNAVASWKVLRALSAEDAQHLIEFRCAVAGRNEPFLDLKVFLRVYEYAVGIPADLVAACSEILTILIQDGRTMANLEDANKAISRIENQRVDDRLKGRSAR